MTLADPAMHARGTRLFSSFFLGGFECSAHRRGDGRRLDLLAATQHDRLAGCDYQALKRHGITTIRDGLRWHAIESADGRYDWSSFLPMLREAERHDIQVIWDLCHYGWPDHIDIWSEHFIDRFARFCASVASLVVCETAGAACYCPINEISYWAWAGGDMGTMNPHAHGRGGDLKRQLCRAAAAATRAVRGVDPQARFITAEPLIHVTSGSPDPERRAAAENYRLFQFEAMDWLSGRAEPGLNGHRDLLDFVGVNFYPENQWYFDGPPIPFGHRHFRPLREMLSEVYQRYERPILISETGAEGSCRPAWLHYVCDEVRAAIGLGVPVAGICLYPVADYPGWENERSCAVGLLSDTDAAGVRKVCTALADEIARQRLMAGWNGSDRPALLAESLL